MSDKKPYCLMPWIHLHVSNNGIAKACCVANIPFGNLNQDPLEDIWQGQAIKNLRGKFLEGKPDNRCANCINREAAGSKSIRQETFEKYPEIKPTNLEAESPIYFDIRFSNVCNFRCRTCWHGASSKWFQDATKLGRNLGKKAIIKNIDDFDHFISKTGEAILGAKEIYFAGGEPLVMEEHYQLLDWLIKNKATDVFLRYNTNFSNLRFKNHDVLDYWAHFSKVEILASIDAMGTLGEYIRKDMSWEKILENRQAIRPFQNIHFKIAPTISVLNAFDLPQLYQNAVAQNLIEPTDFYINILERPFFYNIKAFPENLKQKLITTYQTFLDQPTVALPASIQRNFEEIISFMMEKDLSAHWPKFLAETKVLDELRAEGFKLF